LPNPKKGYSPRTDLRSLVTCPTVVSHLTWTSRYL